MDKVSFASLITIRSYKAEDKAFILSTFLRGLYYGDYFFGDIPKDIFMANYAQVGEALITRGAVMVACDKEDENIILGYSILSEDFSTIHFVYVKNKWRNKGIARELTPDFPTSVSHLTKLGKQLLQSKFPNTVFNPFKL